MGLTANGIANGFSGRLKGVGAAALAQSMQSTIHNAAAFGQITSVPQGYNDMLKAIKPTLKVGGNISTRSGFRAELTADVKAVGNISATVEIETDVIANANVAGNIYATVVIETDVEANLTAIGNISSSIDIIARPSAFDIAQEIWNSPASGFNNAGTTGRKLNEAESAAKLAAALSA